MAAVGECLDFNPGINYMRVEVDPATVRQPFQSSMAYGLLSTFSEQIAVNNLQRSDSSIAKFSISSTKAALSAAVGLGDDASFLFRPTDEAVANNDLSLKFLASDESSIASDRRSIFITNGFINRISMGAIATVFGSVDGYKAHLNDVATHNYSDFLMANNIVLSETDNSLPIGYVLFGKDVVRSDPTVSAVSAFANEFLGKLLFATAHEIGHIRLQHNERAYGDCQEFEKRELAADRYAARYLANFVFRMDPDEFDKQRLIDFSSFFRDYGEYEFSGKSSRGDCAYPSATLRAKEVKKAVYRATVKLKQETYSSADYTTPNPTSVICNNGSKSWRVYFGDQFYVPEDEMRRRSIIESKKVEAEIK